MGGAVASPGRESPAESECRPGYRDPTSGPVPMSGKQDKERGLAGPGKSGGGSRNTHHAPSYPPLPVGSLCGRGWADPDAPRGTPGQRAPDSHNVPRGVGAMPPTTVTVLGPAGMGRWPSRGAGKGCDHIWTPIGLDPTLGDDDLIHPLKELWGLIPVGLSQCIRRRLLARGAG